MITTATEEYTIGGSGAAGEGDDSYIIVAGGTTATVVESYGLGSWSWVGEFIDYDGETATANALANKGTGNNVSILPINDANNVVFATGVDDAAYLANAPTAANHCWTAIHAKPGATDVERALIGGYAMSITSCVKHAVDGYSFWGAIIIAMVGKDWAAN